VGEAGTWRFRRHLLGWKAMPLAREDLDSNYVLLVHEAGAWSRASTLVNMEGVEAMVEL
jgi:hypothetical protein